MSNEFQEEPYRIVIVILYMIVSTMTASINYSFSPITSSLQKAYATTEFDIYYVGMSYSIVFIPLNFLANYIIDKYGARVGLAICCFMQFIGAFCRIFINSSFWYVIFGQTLGSIGNPFGVNIISMLSLYWFLPKNRVISTAFMTCSYMIGTSLAFLAGGWFVNYNSSVSEIQEAVRNLMLFYLIIAGSVFLMVVILFKERPTKPTSYVSEIGRESYMIALKTLIHNKNYVYLCFGFAFLLSNYVIFVTFINYLMEPFGFSESEIEYVGFGINLACVLGKILVGFVAGKSITFRKSLIIISLSSIVAFFLLMFALVSKNYAFLVCVSLGLGFFLQMYWAPSLEFSCEIVFPISEANANGNLLLNGCIFDTVFGALFSFALAYLKNNVGVYITYAYFFLSYFLAAFFFYKIKDEFKRSDKETEIIFANKK